MIYGQSGGGSKVTTLLGMPSAEGLIHRASAQSGGGGNLPTAEQASEFARRVIARLGVTDIAALQKIEWLRLKRGRMAIAAEMNPPPGPAGPFATRRVGSGQASTAASSRCGPSSTVLLRSRRTCRC